MTGKFILTMPEHGLENGDRLISTEPPLVLRVLHAIDKDTCSCREWSWHDWLALWYWYARCAILGSR